MKKKIVLKHALTITLLALFSMNLISCNEFIEVGLTPPPFGEIFPWYEFKVGIKAKKRGHKIQNIEVFYGNTDWLDYDIDKNNYSNEGCAQVLDMDESQILEFKLVRYVYASSDDSRFNRASKSEEILTMQNTLGYFLRDSFRQINNSIIDTIEINDLVKDYDEYGIIRYWYTIYPIESGPIKVFVDNEPVYLNNIIESYNGIHYKIDIFNRIVFKDSSYQYRK